MSDNIIPNVTANDEVPLDAILEALVDDPDVVDDQTDLNSRAPTKGRVAKASDTGKIYLGNGTAWIDVEASSGIDTPALTADKVGSPNNPTSEVHTQQFSLGSDGPATSFADIGGGGGGKILFTSDWHYNEAGGRAGASATTASNTKTNLDTIIDNANDNFNPDHVFVGGDIADYNTSSSASEFVSWLNEVIDYFENRGGSGGGGINAPVTYLVGDHEYNAVGPNSTLFDVFGWADESESWGATTVGGIKILHLNTVVGEVKDGGNEDKTIPSSEITFIENELADAEDAGQPVMTLSHVPLWGGPLENQETKDNITNSAEVLKLVNDSPMYLGAIAGHLHHEESFQRVRSIEDPYGSRHIINPTPNNWMQDTSKVPFVNTVLSGDGSFAADVPLTSSTYATNWTDPGLASRRRSRAQSLVTDQSQSFRWLTWESLNGWEEVSADGTATIDAATGALELSTGATAGNTETIRKNKTDTPTTRNLNFDGPIILRFAWELVSGPSTFDFHILVGGSDTEKHMGFLVQDGNLYFDMNDGAGNLDTIHSDGFYTAPYSNGRSMIAAWPGSQAEYWEAKSNWDSSGSFDEGVTLNNIPSGTRDGDVLLDISVTTDQATDLVVRIHELELFVGSISEPVTIKTQSSETRS